MEWAVLDPYFRIAVLGLIGWNSYLFQQTLNNRDALFRFRLYVAEHYTSKSDLEKLLSGMEARLEQRLSQFIDTLKTLRN